MNFALNTLIIIPVFFGQQVGLSILDSVVNKLDLSAAETGKYAFTHYNITQGLALSIFYCIMQDKKDNLWFGSSNSGVIKFDGKFFTRYTTAQGLSNSSVNTALFPAEFVLILVTSTSSSSANFNRCIWLLLSFSGVGSKYG